MKLYHASYDHQSSKKCGVGVIIHLKKCCGSDIIPLKKCIFVLVIPLKKCKT